MSSQDQNLSTCSGVAIALMNLGNDAMLFRLPTEGIEVATAENGASLRLMPGRGYVYRSYVGGIDTTTNEPCSTSHDEPVTPERLFEILGQLNASVDQLESLRNALPSTYETTEAGRELLRKAQYTSFERFMGLDKDPMDWFR